MASSMALRSSASMTTAGTCGQTRHAGGAPAALAGDDLIVAGLQLPHRQRLDDAVLADGVRQIGQRVGVKLLPGLGGAALHLGNGEEKAALDLRLIGKIVAQQGVQTLAETLAFLPYVPFSFRSGMPLRQAFFFKNSPASAA